jgi:hypothetical protein
MEQKFQCLYCVVEVSDKNDLKEHMQMHIDKRYPCPDCPAGFSRRYHLEKHRNGKCPGVSNSKEISLSTSTNIIAIDDTLYDVDAPDDGTSTITMSNNSTDIAEILKRLSKLEEPKDSNKQLVSKDKDQQVEIVCLAKGDYIKKLEELYDGDIEKAMIYIRNVGIATDFLEGDFRLIKRLYFDGKKKSEFPIRVKDFKRNKLEYLEENGEWVLDVHGEIVGKRLCDNIVNTLLIANSKFSEMIINEKDEDKKELLLDLYQINKTQAHILKLTERKTQCKLSRRVAEFINFCTELQNETGSLDNLLKLD